MMMMMMMMIQARPRWGQRRGNTSTSHSVAQRRKVMEADPLSIAETYQGMFYTTHLW